MRIINKKYLLIILLVGVILTGVIIFKPKERVKLDNVILKQEVNNKTFAMYKEESENNYVLVEDTKFPEGYALNVTESNCIDNNGNEIKDALSYENGEVTITSGKTIYCYLYFDKTLGVEIKEKEPKGLKIDKIRGAMYRFQGQAKDAEGNELVDNYICFGTSDKDTCTKDTDHYMYRIIGVEASTGRVKVIKKEALNETVQWWNNYNDDTEFPESNIYKAINGNNFLLNKSYIPSDWEGRISNNTWMYGDMLENDNAGAKQTGQGLYETETGQKETKWRVKSTDEDGGIPAQVEWENNDTYSQGTILYYKEETGNWNKKIKSKISLMYLNDYSYSIGDEAKCNLFYEGQEYSKCKLGWIHLSQNDPGLTGNSTHEWTMSRLGWWPLSGAFYGFYVNEAGYTCNGFLSNSLSVRPVFYINASEELLSGNDSGTGTITDPFIIK